MKPDGGGLILAAGRSSRYGSDKRRACIDGERSMLEATLSVWHSAVPTLRVVLRAEDEPGEPELASSLRERFPALAITFATHARNGMGASLAAGIRDCAHWDYALIGLGDMPYLRPTTLRHLLTALQQQVASTGPASIIRPVHQHRPGHPVGFGHAHFTTLSRLDGDVGARSVIEANPDVIDLPCADPGIHRDVDTPADRD